MHIVFFEVQDWERNSLLKIFPDALITAEKLTIENALHYTEAEVVSCFIYSKIDKAVIEMLPQLKYITTRSTGFDHIDVTFAGTKGIKTSNVPEYGSTTVAEHTFALMLSLTRKMYQSVNQAKTLSFEHSEIRGVDLEGKTLGIVGLGKIGQHVLQIAKGFGMNVLAYNHSQDKELLDRYTFSYAELDVVFSNSDIITLHLPFNEHTKHIVNKEAILKFKKGSYLINTARGGLIDSEAIVIGLEKEILDGVGLDVLEEEKDLSEEIAMLTSEFRQNIDLKNLIYNHILMNHPKVLITPHNAFNSKEALKRILETTISNIQNYASDTPTNLVGA
ncbi:MAG: hypothetical protein RI947_903 [Candidatus Parcubacteria bacterium]|jgi:D-lactate dehydrogenase